MVKSLWIRVLCNISLVSSALAHVCIGCDWTPPPKPDKDRVVLGIDLGLSSAVMSVDRDNSGNLIIIPNEQGEISHPYQTTFHDPLAAHNEANTITRSVPLHKMHQQSIFCPSDVDENHWDAVKFRHTGKERDSAYAELFAIVLGDLKRRAEVFLGKNVSEATIVVPNHIPRAHLYILQTAGTLAQLDILDMSPRPYAAVYAHTSYSSWEDCYVLVFDLGDYTTVSIVQVAYGKTIPLATTSPDYFSGHDLDHPVIHYLSQLHNNKTGIDVSQDSKALAKLKIAVKRARHDLSVQETTVVTIEALSHDIDLVETLSRDELEHLNAVAFNKILPLVNQMFHGVETIYDTSSITIEDVSEVILTGDSPHIPVFRQLLTQFFGKEPVNDFAPAEISANSAAIYGSSIAMAKSEAFEHWCGCHLEMPLGIEAYGGVMMHVVPRKSRVPFKRASIFSTVYDNQTTILVRAYEGVRALTKENNFIGEFQLSGIPPAPRGTPQIEITIEINEDFLTTVTASHGGRLESISTPMSSYSHPDWVRNYEAARESAQDIERESWRQRIESLELLLSDIHRLKLQVYDLDHSDYASQDLRRNSISPWPGPEETLHLGGFEALDMGHILVGVIRDADEWLESNSSNATAEMIDEERSRLRQHICRLVDQNKN